MATNGIIDLSKYVRTCSDYEVKLCFTKVNKVNFSHKEYIMKNIQLKIKQQSITLKLVCAEIEDILICDREYASAFCVVNNNNYVVFFKLNRK